MQKNTSKKGFTLVEIMIVVVIIGLLAAMAIPAFEKVRSNSKEGAMHNDARQIASAAQQYMLENDEIEVAHEYNDGVLGAELAEYVARVGKGYTIAPADLTLNGTFSIQHAQANGNVPIVYTAEGQKQ